MAIITDPARELSDIAKKLAVADGKKGSAFLAEKFGVQPWSTEFFKIITCIMERADLIASVIFEAVDDDEIRREAHLHLDGFKEGFSGSSLVNNWNAEGHGVTAMKIHGSPIKFLSSQVRQFVAYPSLSDEEIAELLGAIDIYLGEITPLEEGPVFVRQAIIDGLMAFKFQLEKIGWLGAGYSLGGFRNLLDIYSQSQRLYAETPDCDPEAVLGGFMSILRSFKEKADEAKGWSEASQFIWDGYSLAARIVTPLLLTSNVLALPSN